MDVDAGVFSQPVADLDAFVGGVVVHHQVQLLVGVGAGDVFEESQKLLMAVAVLADAGDLAGGDVQRSEEGRGAVADVVVGVPLGAVRLHRQHRLGAVQRLDLAFLIDAQHDRVLGWVQIQADDVVDLGDQFGVGGEFERLGPPRLDPVLAPGLGHRRETDPQLVGQQPRTPMRDTKFRRRRPQRRGDDLAVIQGARSTRSRTIDQPANPELS